MIKKVIVCVVLLAMVMVQPVLATTSSQKLNEVNNQLSQKESDLQIQKNAANKALKNIKATETQIETTEDQLGMLEGEIAELQQRIESKKSQIALEEERLAVENENVNKMVNYMYYQDDYTALSLLLESDNIIEALTSLDMYKMIQESNVERIKKVEQLVEDLKNQKIELDELNRTLKVKQSNLEYRKGQLLISKDATEDARQEILKDIASIEKEIDTLNAEADKLISQIRSEQDPTKQYSGGTFLWPTPGNTHITSAFGMRMHPILKVNKMHTGIDISAPSGADVVAVNSGTVIMAEYNGSYGNVVIIDHGGGIVTLYAHNSKLLVLKGDEVSKGQVISKVGSTGRSTGPHCHFEVRKNGEYVNPMNWL